MKSNSLIIDFDVNFKILVGSVVVAIVIILFLAPEKEDTTSGRLTLL